MKVCALNCSHHTFPDHYNFCPYCGTKLTFEIHMEPDVKKQLEEIISGMECPKDFRCYRSGLESLCKAKDIGIETFLECLEENPQDCKFSSSFGNSHFCQCPLRVYIAKKLKK